jgi:hypothetical protein
LIAAAIGLVIFLMTPKGKQLTGKLKRKTTRKRLR